LNQLLKPGLYLRPGSIRTTKKDLRLVFEARSAFKDLRYSVCRYDLGSGRKVLRSREPITLGRFHRLSAKRYGRDGVLRVDGGRDVSGVSPGYLRSLNVRIPLYLGGVANITDRCKS